jgi:tryptophan synthase alpha chain
MSRIAEAFTRLAQPRRPGLVTYITAGDPDLGTTREILEALDRAGADVLEVGVPFSDPMADGPVIQRASERALAGGATLDGVLEMIARIRPAVRAPIVLFSYANPLYRMGFERFSARAAAAGVDGVLALDLPLEESGDLHGCLRGVGLDMIFLFSPTTSTERMIRAGELGSGFVYAISRLGVTGTRDSVASGVQDLVARARASTTLPVAVGFGVSTAAHVAEVCAWADAAVVGSALVEVIERYGASPHLIPQVEQFVRRIRGEPA